MALKIANVALWSAKIEDRPGGAADVLKSLADAKVNLEFVLARRTPEVPGRGILFVAPIAGAAAEQAASGAGLVRDADIAALRIEGDNRAGVGHAIARAVAGAGVSFRGLSANTHGKTYVCILALDTADDARKASEAIQAALPSAAPKTKKPARKKKRR